METSQLICSSTFARQTFNELSAKPSRDHTFSALEDKIANIRTGNTNLKDT